MTRIAALACAALLLAGAAAAADEAAAVERGKKLITANAENICLFAHASSTYGYKEHAYVGQHRTADGHLELVFTFTVKGNLKTQKMQMGFFFDKDGRFEFLRVRDYSTIYEPFKRLSSAYLKELRDQMAKRPVVQNNSELLRTVDGCSAQDLCEMHLKLVQVGMRAKR
jgi:hypothetical protein